MAVAVAVLEGQDGTKNVAKIRVCVRGTQICNRQRDREGEKQGEAGVARGRKRHEESGDRVLITDESSLRWS